LEGRIERKLEKLGRSLGAHKWLNMPREFVRSLFGTRDMTG